MRLRSMLLGAAAMLALSSAANAGTISGWYIGLEGGANWIDDLDGFAVGDAPLTINDFSSPFTVQFDTGWAVLATVGYGFGGNWRMELEGGYRRNETSTATGDTDLSEWTAMFNVLYDIHLSQSMNLTLGAGGGGDFARWELEAAGFDDDEWNFAYQGIAGLSYSLSRRLDLMLTYRYLRVLDPEFSGAVISPAGAVLTHTFDDIGKHTATVGLRYAFGAPEPAPEPVVAPPPPPPPPPPPAPKQFIIFFGFNKCNITAEADGVLSNAAEAAKQTGAAAIAIVGHTDTSGSNAYNQKLSLCRADAAKSNLVGKGIAAAMVTVTGKGETELMVQTGDGVKEPQNRRATVDLQ